MNKKAFTLIELLAVIAILAIVLLIAIPTVLNMIERGRKGAMKDSTLGVIKAAKTMIGLHTSMDDMNIVWDDNEAMIKIGTDKNTEIVLDNDKIKGGIIVTRNGKKYTFEAYVWDGNYRACMG